VGKDVLIQIHTRIDGQRIGGMSYQVDPGLKHLPSQHPGREHTDSRRRQEGENEHQRRLHHAGGRTRIIVEIDGDE
jgi:hypothetical protein